MTTSHTMDLTLDKDISAFTAMKDELQRAYFGKWVVFYNSQFQGNFEDFNAAATYAVGKFGRGPYLIRQVGQEDMVLPTSVVYTVSHATG